MENQLPRLLKTALIVMGPGVVVWWWCSVIILQRLPIKFKEKNLLITMSTKVHSKCMHSITLVSQ
jgi:hypothetical protein